MHIHTVLYVFPVVVELVGNQRLLWWVIISLILTTLMFESTVILLGEIRSQSLLGLKGKKAVSKEVVEKKARHSRKVI